MKYSEAKIEEVRERFERDFLPKYGTLWRTMIENGAAGKQTAPTSSSKAGGVDFLSAIQNRTAVSIRAPTNHESGCDCGCVPPIEEWEEREKPPVESPSSSENSSQSSSWYDSPSNSLGSVQASTPLPAEFEKSFGRINLGAGTLDGEHDQTDQRVAETRLDFDSTLQGETNIMAISLSEEYIPPASDGVGQNKPCPASAEQDSKHSDEEGDGSSEDDADSYSSGSTVIRFDTSFIIQEALETEQEDIEDSNQNGMKEPSLTSHRSPLSGSPETSKEKTSDRDFSPDNSDGESQSSGSTVYQVDLSHILDSTPSASAQRTSEESRHVNERRSDSTTSSKASEGTVYHDMPALTEMGEPGVVISEPSLKSKYDPTTAPSASFHSTSRSVPLQVYSDTSESTNDNTAIDLVDSGDENEKDNKAFPEKRGGAHELSSEEEEWDEESLGSDSSPEPILSPGFRKGERQSRKPTKCNQLMRSDNESDDGTPDGLLGSDSNRRLPAKHPEPSIKTTASFKRNKEAMSKRYFEEFNVTAFDGRLSSVEVTWSNKLRTTAGLTRLKRCTKVLTPGIPVTRLASIELSSKVLDSQERLRSTLLHELVHAAAWIIDGVSKPPHGACFKKWANIAMARVSDVEVTTTHDYEIQYKYAWACTTSGCSFIVKRHSRSVDPKRHRCGRCRGKLIEVNATNGKSSSFDPANPTPRKRAVPSAYNTFVKEESKGVRARLMKAQEARGIRNPKVTQPDVMKECARLWREKKQAGE